MGVFVFFGEFGYVLDHREKDFGCLCENFCVGVFDGGEGFVGIVIVSDATNLFFGDVKDFEETQYGLIPLEVFFLHIL